MSQMSRMPHLLSAAAHRSLVSRQSNFVILNDLKKVANMINRPYLSLPHTCAGVSSDSMHRYASRAAARSRATAAGQWDEE